MRIVIAALFLLMLLSLHGVQAETKFKIDLSGLPEASGLQIEDRRESISVKGGRPGLFSIHMNFLGDGDFSPNRIELFRRAVASAFHESARQVVLKNFDVIDIYPQRMGAQPVKLSFASKEIALGMGVQEVDVDSILCFINADVDGRNLSFGLIVKYKGSPTAFWVYKDPPVKAAVEKAVLESLNGWIERAKAR